MAKILYLTQVLPYPLDSGAKVRQYHMIQHLCKQHVVTLVSFTRPDDPPEAVEKLSEICHEVHLVSMQRSLWRNVRASVKGLATGLPILVTRDEIAEMNALLTQLARQTAFDVIHADQLSMAGYGMLAARKSRSHRPRTLLDEHNAFYLLVRRMADTEPQRLRRLAMAREARAFARYEAGMCRTYDAVLTVIPEDRDHLLSLFRPEERATYGAKFAPIPICVDPGVTAPVARSNAQPPTILHLGTMFWPPNSNGVLWFAREVLPLIHNEMPETRFVVIGKNPPKEVEALAADPRIKVTGYVEDLAPYLAQTDAFVVPLHAGSGMRVKILDAWMWGLPIVSTPIGAEGIRVREEETILLAETASDFAAATLRLLNNPKLNQKLRINGRAWVEQHYSWDSVYRRVDEVYQSLLRSEEAVDSAIAARGRVPGGG